MKFGNIRNPWDRAVSYYFWQYKNETKLCKAKFLKISKKAVESEFVSMTSLNTWVYEKDIGKMCCYLISDESSRISGRVVGVDGNTLRMH